METRRPGRTWINEPVTALTDLILSAMAVYFAVHLGRLVDDRRVDLDDLARHRLALANEIVAGAGRQLVVEFLPWSAIPDLATAWSLVAPLDGAARITSAMPSRTADEGTARRKFPAVTHVASPAPLPRIESTPHAAPGASRRVVKLAASVPFGRRGNANGMCSQ